MSGSNNGQVEFLFIILDALANATARISRSKYVSLLIIQKVLKTLKTFCREYNKNEQFLKSENKISVPVSTLAMRFAVPLLSFFKPTYLHFQTYANEPVALFDFSTIDDSET